MSDVPPDRRSTHALYEELREAGRRRAEEQREPARSRRPRAGSRVLAPALSAALAFLVVGGGVAVGTRVFVHDDGTSTVGPGVPADVRHAPGDRRTAQATAADPAKPDLRWGMRIYPNQKGETCLQPGRFLNGRIGAIQAGKFLAYPDDTVGACTDLAREHAMVWTWNNKLGSEPRSILYGAVDRTVTRLSVGPPGAGRTIAIAHDGTYMVVRVGDKSFDGDVLVVERGGAAPRTIELHDNTA